MSVPKRLLLIVIVLGMGNIPLLFVRFTPALPMVIFTALFLGGLLLWCCLRPGPRQSTLPKKLRQLAEGCALYETTFLTAILLLAEHAVLPALPAALRLPLPLFFANLFAGVGLLIFPLTVGLLRVLYASEQLDALYRYLILATWWIPLIGIFLNLPTYQAARRELLFVRERHLRNLQRRDRQICRTTFPLLLLHSRFYPDWKPSACWGRIPDALEQNGAVLYYGDPSAATDVSQCAQELQAAIQDVLAHSGAEKVNIIAHSRRGLDARYAISALGLADRVASLTTICTPHRGCLLARDVLEQLPHSSANAAASQRDQLISQVADQYPNFYSSVAELTPEACAALNQRLPDAPGVYYQSIGAQMASKTAAGFPFNMSYNIIHPIEGDNDGLVATSSMPWGEAYREVTPPSAQGISHGDMIDLTRRNIPGFDVCEFYVELVQALRERGL